MKNVNEKINIKPILFTHLNGESEPIVDGAVSILLKWDAGINNKLGAGNDVAVDTNAIIQESEQEHQHFRILLMQEMISRQSNLDKQELIETVSIYFIRLMDSIFDFTKGKYVAEKLKTVAEKICLHFQQTFEFINDFFGYYINRERKAPSVYTEITKAEILKKLIKAKADFIAAPENSVSLIDILVSVITEELSGTAGVSINSIRYINQLTDEIYRHSKSLTEENLRIILYGFNFNEESFVMAEYERFAALTPDTLSKNERIRLLKQQQKAINQVVVRLNCYWENSMPPLKDQLNGWLNEEILFIDSGTASTANQNGAVESYDKVQTSLSVAKLALILRVLVIDKIIINRQVAPVLRTITKVFATLQKDDISFGSMETKYHAPDKATITNVRDMLFKWINILGKL